VENEQNGLNVKLYYRSSKVTSLLNIQLRQTNRTVFIEEV